MHSIKKSVLINSSLPDVWCFLTKPELMIKWTGEPEMEIQIVTDWIVGNPFVITGFHHVRFESNGVVLKFDPHRIIQYSQLNSVSRLKDVPENHSITTFLLDSINGQTLLTLMVENFPTETIYKHLDFYWQGTLDILKQMIEKQ